MVTEYPPNAVPTFPSDSDDKRKLTYGEKAVGLSFNPSANPKVDRVKELFAEIIDLCNSLRAAEGGLSEKKRLLSVAITEAQTAQMWAVKGITYQH